MDMTAAVPNLGPRVLKAAIDGPSVVASLSRHQTSFVIREETVGLQASRVLRWRLTIGDCYVDAAVPRRDASD